MRGCRIAGETLRASAGNGERRGSDEREGRDRKDEVMQGRREIEKRRGTGRQEELEGALEIREI